MRSAPRNLATATLALLLAASAAARADELKIDWSARIQTDLRFRTETKSIGDFYDRLTLPSGVERNQNLFGLKLNAKYGKFAGVADLAFVINGYSGKLQGLSDLNNAEAVQPYYFDINSLYVDGKDLFVKGFDLRVGQQLVLWGVGDQFNPTNNLNADDLRDPLLFGKQVGNFMVKGDYWLNDDWSASAVLVPIFKPALLPTSAPLGIAAVDRLPFVDPGIRHRIESESAFGAALGYPTLVSSATPVLPDPTLANMQVAFRLAGAVAGQDVALSYYQGRTDFPQPVHNQTTQSQVPICDAQSPACTKGALQTAVELGYPKMHVYGLNATGEIPLSWLKDRLRGIGYRLEGALVVPDPQALELTNDKLALGIVTQPAGEYDYGNDGRPGSGRRPLVVDPTPFLKWVLGLDYAFGDHVYVNAQWVHGLLDEYGAGDFLHQGYAVRQSGVTTTSSDTFTKCVVPKNGDRCASEILRNRLGDYAVLGVDLKFLSGKALLRLFGIVDVTGYVSDQWSAARGARVQTVYSPFSGPGYSFVLYPDLNYNFGNGLEMGAGALLQLGRDYTKFGDPAAGGSVVFTRARFSF